MDVDWIDVWLWVLRIVIIVGVLVDIVRRLVFGVGTTYQGED